MNAYHDSIKRIMELPDLPVWKLAGSNILVTGATGLIGSSLVDALMSKDKMDYHVYALGRNTERAKKRFASFFGNPFFHFIKHDITKPLTINIDFQYIVHAASNASPNFFVSNPVEIIKSNVYGLCNLFDYGRFHHLKRLLFVSSSEVYGEGMAQVFDESFCGYINQLSSRSCYPLSKRLAETLCVSYAGEYNLDVVIARPCHVYGPFFTESDNRVYAQFLRNVINNQDILMKSSGVQYRSWCYVVDCVSALLFILLKGITCEAYNIAGKDSNLSIKSLASIIAGLANKRIITTEPSETEKRGFNPFPQSTLSNKKLLELGWTSLFDIQQGLKETLEALRRVSPI